MKLAPNRIVEFAELPKPTRKLFRPHPSLTPLFRIPIDHINGIVRGQASVCPTRVIIYRAKAAHRTIGNVRAVLLGNLLVPLSHEVRLLTKINKGLVDPSPRSRST